MKKRILFVCLGNICRSPAAEAVFLKMIEERSLKSNYEADSAGTGGWHVGNKADIRMRNAALRRGITINSISRKISSSDFDTFDFILTMDNDNLEAVNFISKNLQLVKNPIIRPILSFSKREIPIEVPDPYYGGDKGFEVVLDLLEDACEGLIENLTNEG